MRTKGCIDPVDRYVGERLRTERRRRHRTQAALAAAIGVTFQQVQKYERGTNRISPAKLQRAADALGVPVADLFPAPDVGVAPADDPWAVPGGLTLAKRFAAMSPARRSLLLRIAEDLAEAV